MSATAIWQEAAVVLVVGGNAVEFLQGYLTCDTQRLTQTTLTPMAVCNVKGRVITSGWAFQTENAVGLVVHNSLADKLSQFLTPYAQFSRCSVVLSDLWLSLVDTNSDSVDSQRLRAGAELGHGIFVLEADKTKHRDGKNQQSAADCSEHLREQLIEHKFAFISAVSSEQFLPQMLGLDTVQAVDFDKGCYLGQEIVARAQFRGAVKKHLQQIAWQDQQPEAGESRRDKSRVICVSGVSQRALAVVSD